MVGQLLRPESIKTQTDSEKEVGRTALEEPLFIQIKPGGVFGSFAELLRSFAFVEPVLLVFALQTLMHFARMLRESSCVSKG